MWAYDNGAFEETVFPEGMGYSLRDDYWMTRILIEIHYLVPPSHNPATDAFEDNSGVRLYLQKGEAKTELRAISYINWNFILPPQTKVIRIESNFKPGINKAYQVQMAHLHG